MILSLGRWSQELQKLFGVEELGVLVESDQAFEMELVGRGSEPVRNPLVGFIEMPLTVSEATPDPRESLLALIGSQAAELNPLDRYADQFALLKAINMPRLKS